jgi:hypothetical protein
MNAAPIDVALAAAPIDAAPAAAPIDAAPAAATNTAMATLEMLLGSKEITQKQIAAGHHSPPEILALRINLAALENEIQAEKDRIVAVRALENRGMT